MSNINTDNIIAPTPPQRGRAGINLSAGQSVGASFDEHLRQAFRPAAGANSKQRPSDADHKTKRTEQSERKPREYRREDPDDGGQVSDRPADAVADDAEASAQVNAQGNRVESQQSQDDSRSSDGETANVGETENHADDGRTKSHDAVGKQTEQDQAISAEAELTAQLAEENSQENIEANKTQKQSTDQQANNSAGRQAEQIAANIPADQTAIEAAANSGNVSDDTQSSNSSTATESDKAADALAADQMECSAQQTQKNQQAADSEHVDKNTTADKNGHLEISTEGEAAEEAVGEMETSTSTGEDAATQNPAAQSQVVAEGTSQEKDRRDSHSQEADSNGEKVGADAAQAAAVPAADAANADAFKSDRKAAARIAIDAAHKDKTDSKATANQPGQNDISLGGRNHTVQDARTATAVQTEQTAGNEDLDTTDRVRFVQRIARAFEGAGRDGGTMRMRLHPSELGSLRLEVTVRDGALTARMETETQAAKNIILDHLPALRDRLAQQDIKIQQFDVDYSGGNNGGSPQSAADQHQSHQYPAARQIGPRAAGNADLENDTIQTTPRARYLGQASRLDFVA